MLDTLEISGVDSGHICLVHEPLGMSIEAFRQLMPTKQLDKHVLKALLKHLLLALDFLHNEANVVHTGIL